MFRDNKTASSKNEAQVLFKAIELEKDVESELTFDIASLELVIKDLKYHLEKLEKEMTKLHQDFFDISTTLEALNEKNSAKNPGLNLQPIELLRNQLIDRQAELDKLISDREKDIENTTELLRKNNILLRANIASGEVKETDVVLEKESLEGVIKGLEYHLLKLKKQETAAIRKELADIKITLEDLNQIIKSEGKASEPIESLKKHLSDRKNALEELMLEKMQEIDNVKESLKGKNDALAKQKRYERFIKAEPLEVNFGKQVVAQEVLEHIKNEEWASDKKGNLTPQNFKNICEAGTRYILSNLEPIYKPPISMNLREFDKIKLNSLMRGNPNEANRKDSC